MPLVRLLLGIVFVLVAALWARRVYRADRRDQQRGVMGMAFDFVSGSPVEVVLIVGLLFLGLLLICGYWWIW